MEVIDGYCFLNDSGSITLDADNMADLADNNWEEGVLLHSSNGDGVVDDMEVESGTNVANPNTTDSLVYVTMIWGITPCFD